MYCYYNIITYDNIKCSFINIFNLFRFYNSNYVQGVEFLPCEEIKEYTVVGMNVESTSHFDVVIDHYKYTNIKK